MAVRQVPVAASRTGASAWRAGARKQPQSLRSDGSQLPWSPDVGRGGGRVEASAGHRPAALPRASSLQPAGVPVDAPRPSASSAHGPVPAPLATCPNPTAAPPALPCAGQAPPRHPVLRRWAERGPRPHALLWAGPRPPACVTVPEASLPPSVETWPWPPRCPRGRRRRFHGRRWFAP